MCIVSRNAHLGDVFRAEECLLLHLNTEIHNLEVESFMFEVNPPSESIVHNTWISAFRRGGIFDKGYLRAQEELEDKLSI